MILPEKHIKLSESLFGLGGFIVHLLDRPQTVEKLWAAFEKINNSPELPVNHSFDNFILSVVYLFTVGVVNINEEGELYAIN